MQLICPECKNIVDLSNHADLAIGHVLECEHCGITLLVKSIDEGNIRCEVADEGK
ncbi:MAG: hypothetical protein Q7S66_01600 [bacterium]|nr:hypothetical protein [bacterium]